MQRLTGAIVAAAQMATGQHGGVHCPRAGAADPGNVDATIIAQAPEMAPHIFQMVDNIAADLRVERSAVNVKATTTEKLGLTGRGEGIAAQAVVMLLTDN